MKCRIFEIVSLSALSILLLAGASAAQSVNLQAKIPFAFVAGDTAYPAGEYVVRSIAGPTKMFTLTNRNNGDAGLRLYFPTASEKPVEESKLVFHQVGNAYFLYQVWTQASSVGIELPQSRAETQMARNVAGTDTIIVVANHLQ